jgi:hypothetical protein
VRKRAGISTAAFVALALTGMCASARAAPGNWDHEANIKDAAERLVILHRRQGSTGVLKFLDACYRTHTIASDYTKGLEACMAQDYIHTKALMMVYGRLPADKMQKMGAPTAQSIAADLNARFVKFFMQYKVTVADADDFKKIVEKVGVPVFLKGVFPKIKGLDDSSTTSPAGK